MSSLQPLMRQSYHSFIVMLAARIEQLLDESEGMPLWTGILHLFFNTLYCLKVEGIWAVPTYECHWHCPWRLCRHADYAVVDTLLWEANLSSSSIEQLGHVKQLFYAAFIDGTFKCCTLFHPHCVTIWWLNAACTAVAEAGNPWSKQALIIIHQEVEWCRSIKILASGSALLSIYRQAAQKLQFNPTM